MSRFIYTSEGNKISLTWGVPTLEDIALNHCRTFMFASYTDRVYSVALHCINVSEIAKRIKSDNGVSIFALLHEVEVAVFGDIPGPVKCSEQRMIEREMRSRIWKSLDLEIPDNWWDEIERYDKIEQRASINFLGFPGTIYEDIWNDPNNHEAKQIAIRVVEENYKKYPVKDNLQKYCPLMLEFMNKFREYNADYRRFVREKREQATNDV